MRKTLVHALLAAVIAAASFASHAGDAKAVLAVGVPKAPPTLPLLRMIETNALGDRAEIRVDVWTAPEQLIAMVQAGGHQMFILPLAVAARLHNKGVGIRLTNVNAWGAAHLVTADPAVNGWSDLRGKTLFAPPRSSTPAALTRYFLAQAGMKPGQDLHVVHTAVAEAAQLLKAGKIDNAILLEPFVTAVAMDNPGLRTVIDYNDEWKRLRGAAAGIPNAGVGATVAFLDAHRELVEVFEKEYAEALAWINANPDEAGRLAEKYLGLRAGVGVAASSRLGLRYVSAAGAREDVEGLYRLLFEFSPDLIGRKIPDASLYWR